jgi:putative ABC transport system permease protein
MTWGLTLRIALRALLRNKLRTLLTMLGIIIGVAAVISMLSIANGARTNIQNSIASMGTNCVHVYGGSRPKQGMRGGKGTGLQMRADDWKAVAQLPTVSEACPVVSGQVQLVYGSANWGTSFTGTTPNFLIIRSWPVEEGRFFTEAEVRAGSHVVVLGKEVARKLFGATDPVDKVIRVANFPMRVIGLMEEKGETGWGMNRDDAIFLPYTTAQRKLKGNQWINSISASAKRADQVAALEEQVVNLLKERYRVRPEEQDAFYAYNQAEASKQADESTRVFSVLLGGIASVSLLVGGIGIMNIMLVSVTERIREIGIRMALGARGIDILSQFLVEAVVLSLMGGALGVALGAGISLAVARVAKWPAQISPSSVWLAFGFSAFVGIFFGFYPALQASRKDPIEALRHE